MEKENNHFEKEDHSHRTSSSFAAYFNIICVVAGTGVLALPATLGDSGWYGIVLFAVTAVASIITSKMLIECLYYKEGSRLEEYPDVAEAAFGSVARTFTKVFHYSISLSGACIYILVSGLNIHTLLQDYAPSWNMHFRYWILVSGVTVGVPFVFLKTIREVTLLGGFWCAYYADQCPVCSDPRFLPVFCCRHVP
ncbi:hypothetical protein DSO57_1026318 [Entomophthora muscae]|uniref:Uncharacterized protein n=1 Tax=Entomophthora muscae TaxID=34485 RepID=A0ACC2TDA4_9FUNG|nr:hypothetical protein DSO57_1026318 [Entomophthora muscae]